MNLPTLEIIPNVPRPWRLSKKHVNDPKSLYKMTYVAELCDPSIISVLRKDNL